MTHSESINELATALAKAQGAIEGALKGKENPHFRSKYADLGAVWDACRDALSKNGISVVQPVGHSSDGTLCTITRICHSSGQWMQDDGIPLLLSKQDMQGLGSALTYSRRYGLMSMVGIAPEDDDGNAATKSSGQVAQTLKASAPVAPAGFEDWLLDLTSTADTGTDALKKMWAGSRPEYRQYLTKTTPETIDTLKAKAAHAEQVSA